jgi:acetyltransferase-like isoleucine patch superfamily enzyme
LIAATAIIHDNVRLGRNVIVEDFCIIGARFAGYQGEETVIGDDAVIRSHTVVYAGNRIGNGFQTGNKANIRELNTIGNGVSIGTHSIVEHHVIIEDGVRIHSQVFVPEFSLLQRGCWVGPGTVITNARYPLHPDAKKELRGATIGPNAKVGAHCTLLPGVTIGAGALVGAGSLVVHDVPAKMLAFGRPARPQRPVDY